MNHRHIIYKLHERRLDESAVLLIPAGALQKNGSYVYAVLKENLFIINKIKYTIILTTVII